MHHTSYVIRLIICTIPVHHNIHLRGSVPRLPGYATAYRWRSPPRICRHSAHPQGIARVIDQLVSAPIFPHPIALLVQPITVIFTLLASAYYSRNPSKCYVEFLFQPSMMMSPTKQSVYDSRNRTKCHVEFLFKQSMMVSPNQTIRFDIRTSPGRVCMLGGSGFLQIFFVDYHQQSA